MGLGIRISMCLRAIELLPSPRFKVDFQVVEFTHHRTFEKPSKENFTVNQPEPGYQLTSERQK